MSFSVGNFRNSEAVKVTFLRKSWKFNTDLKRAEKNWEKIFCFWEKCLWIVCIELSLLIREYLSSAVNVLTKSLKTFHVTKSDFCNSITFTMINQYDKALSLRLNHCFGPSTMSSVEGSSQTGAFGRLYKHLFRGR